MKSKWGKDTHDRRPNPRPNPQIPSPCVSLTSDSFPLSSPRLLSLYKDEAPDGAPATWDLRLSRRRRRRIEKEPKKTLGKSLFKLCFCFFYWFSIFTRIVLCFLFFIPSLFLCLLYLYFIFKKIYLLLIQSMLIRMFYIISSAVFCSFSIFSFTIIIFYVLFLSRTVFIYFNFTTYSILLCRFIYHNYFYNNITTEHE